MIYDLNQKLNSIEKQIKAGTANALTKGERDLLRKDFAALTADRQLDGIDLAFWNTLLG